MIQRIGFNRIAEAVNAVQTSVYHLCVTGDGRHITQDFYFIGSSVGLTDRVDDVMNSLYEVVSHLWFKGTQCPFKYGPLGDDV